MDQAFRISGSIVSGNHANGVPDNLDGYFFGGGYNLLGDGDVPSGSFDVTGVNDPMLGPLADNGGPTLTHALLPGSPAINASDPAAVVGVNDVAEYDQRGAGFERIVDGQLDIGSFELQQNGSPCDLDGDADCDISDLDLLYLELGGSVSPFDLDGSGVVDNEDVSEWLNLSSIADPQDRTFVRGDANLDGQVGGSDFTTLAANFGSSGGWADGNFVVDPVPGGGIIGGSDFTSLAVHFGFTSALGRFQPVGGDADNPEEDAFPSARRLVDAVFRDVSYRGALDRPLAIRMLRLFRQRASYPRRAPMDANREGRAGPLPMTQGPTVSLANRWESRWNPGTRGSSVIGNRNRNPCRGAKS